MWFKNALQLIWVHLGAYFIYALYAFFLVRSQRVKGYLSVHIIIYVNCMSEIVGGVVLVQ